MRGYDVRPAVKEQVQSLGGEFLEVSGIQESGEGQYYSSIHDNFHHI